MNYTTTTTTNNDRSKYRREILYCIEHYSIAILIHHHTNTVASSSSPATYVPVDLYEIGDYNINNNNDQNNNTILITSPSIHETRTCAQNTMDTIRNKSSSQPPQQHQQHGSSSLLSPDINNIVECTTEIYTNSDTTTTTTMKDDFSINNRYYDHHHCNKKSRIRYVTHAVLLHEITTIDPLLLQYNIIIINHDRCSSNVSTDILLGVLYKIRLHRLIQQQQQKLKPLRLVFIINTNNDHHHIQTKMLLQYFLDGSEERAQQCIDRCSCSSIVSNSSNTTTTTSSTITNAIDTNHNHNNNDAVILSLYDHPLCPVNLYYLSEPISDYIITMIETIWYIIQQQQQQQQNNNNNSGDILCFLPSENDITIAIKMAQDYVDQQQQQQQYQINQKSGDSNMSSNIDFVPFTKSLSQSVQDEILQQQVQRRSSLLLRNRSQKQQSKRRHRCCRVIFTNINVEWTTITVIPNIRYVIDCGYTEVSNYFDANIGLYRNTFTIPISQQHAQQRSSYASTMNWLSSSNNNNNINQNNTITTTPTSTTTSFVVGECYRLYTETYLTTKMNQTTLPEITRTDMTYVILYLKSIGIDNLFTFDFITLPNIESIRYGLETLYILGAIDDTTSMTSLGYEMAQLAIEPRLARTILASIQYNCTWEILTIASVMYIPLWTTTTDTLPIRHLLQTKPKSIHSQQVIDYEEIMSNVADMTGDHISYWNIFSDIDQQYTVDYDYCREHYLQYHTVRQCLQIRKQLARALKRIRTTTTIGLFHPTNTSNNIDQQQSLLDRSQAILRCVTTGYIMNVAKLHHDGQYYTIRNDDIMVVPTTYSFYTSFSKISSEYIIFCQSGNGGGGGGGRRHNSNNSNSIVEIQHVSSIEAKWLREIAPGHFFA